jgi:arylsulfatase A-like enzyme/Flp pilus assembly protein TadD
VSCASKGPAQHLLLITIDTIRADRLSCYGYRQPTTPQLDRLAASGTRFEQAVAPAPLTLPAHCSLMTGNYPTRHGVRINEGFVLAPQNRTLAEALKGGGFVTGAVIGAFVLAKPFGLAQGFDHYDDEVTTAPGKENNPFRAERAADQVAERAIAWLRQHAQAPRLFLWTHFYDPHAAYQPPAQYRHRFGAYEGEIAYTDAAIGRLLDAIRELGLERTTLVAVVGDHGESRGEHGERTHGLFVYDSTLRVPLILSGPGAPRGRVIRSQVPALDLAPTVLELLGLSAQLGSDGRSLAAQLRGAPGSDRIAYSESHYGSILCNWSALESLRDGRWKYIRAPRAELYNLERDPNERVNRIGAEKNRAARMSAALDRVLAQAGDPQLLSAAVADTSSEAAARLRSLGYLGGASTLKELQARPPSQVDPKDKVAVWLLLDRGTFKILNGELAQGAELLSRALQQDPGNLLALKVLSKTLPKLGRGEEAIALSHRLLETGFFQAEAWRDLGLRYLEAQQPPKAARAFGNSLEHDPDNVAALNNLAVLALRNGERPRALDLLHRALAAKPDNREAQRNLAELESEASRAALGRGDRAAAIAHLSSALEHLPERGDLRETLSRTLAEAGQHKAALREIGELLRREPERASALLVRGKLLALASELDHAAADIRRSVELDPQSAEAQSALASLLARSGDRGGAEAAFRRAAELDPKDAIARYNLGMLAAQRSDWGEARRELRSALAIDPALSDARAALNRLPPG